MNGDRELSELFAAERAVRPSADVAERGLVRLADGLASPALAPAATKLGWASVSKWVLGGLLLGGGGSGVATALFDPAPSQGESATHAAPRPSPQPAAAAIPPTTTPSHEPSPPASLDATERSEPRRGGSSRAVAPAAALPGRETFDAELRLIDGAKVELDRGRPHIAKVWLGEHAARYPRGVFSTDREALQVLVSCAERPEPARAARFVAAHPTSPLSERLTRECEAPNPK